MRKRIPLPRCFSLLKLYLEFSGKNSPAEFENCCQTQMRLTELQGEQADLKTQLETVGTDAFIENQARTMYGYMMPDEIRFVITNPEALYGEDEIPSR